MSKTCVGSDAGDLMLLRGAKVGRMEGGFDGICGAVFEVVDKGIIYIT